MAHKAIPPASCIREFLVEPAYASTAGSQSGYEFITENADYAVFTPMVELTINGKVILLEGNESSPQTDNRACITSFQYGTSTGTGGCGIKVEGIDTEGSTYRAIVEALNKDMTKVHSKDQGHGMGKPGCAVEFGWRMQDCDNVKRKITNLTHGDPWPPAGKSAKINLVPMTLQTNFDGGSIKFILEATDGFIRSAENPHETAEGTDEAKKTLTEAIKAEFEEKDPKFNKVRFDDRNGAPFEFNVEDGFKDGYVSTHQSEQESNVTCTRRWLNDTTTDGGKGFLILYNPEDAGIVILEDPQSKECKAGSVATYVVNGGNQSAVISFTPSITWPLGGHSGSGGMMAAGSEDRHGEEVKAEEQPGLQPTGSQMSPGLHTSQDLWRNKEGQAERTKVTMRANMLAEKPYTVQTAISAEIKVFGNPRFVNPVFLTGKWISIVVLEPRYISADTVTGGSCEWVSTTNCNPVLSNKKWMITGVDHQITSGSYVTTLKVFLPAPNNEVKDDEPLGGDGCGTEMTNAGAGKPKK